MPTTFPARIRTFVSEVSDAAVGVACGRHIVTASAAIRVSPMATK